MNLSMFSILAIDLVVVRGSKLVEGIFPGREIRSVRPE